MTTRFTRRLMLGAVVAFLAAPALADPSGVVAAVGAGVAGYMLGASAWGNASQPGVVYGWPATGAGVVLAPGPLPVGYAGRVVGVYYPTSYPVYTVYPAYR